MIDRRSLLAGMAAMPFIANASLAQATTPEHEAPKGLHKVLIPGADVLVPIVGIGTARRYSDPETDAQMAALRDTLARFVELGGSVIDTAPSYGRAEEVVGQLVSELGLRDKLFYATKIGVNSREEGLAQIEESFRKMRTDRLDLVAVHNIRDVENQLAILGDLKSAGRVGAVGITTSFEGQYEEFEAVMRRHSLDCIQIDYALDNRSAADRILPLAQEQGVAVMINLPFGRERLFEATRNVPLPDWATEIGATSWAQVFLKYVVSTPANRSPFPALLRSTTRKIIWQRQEG